MSTFYSLGHKTLFLLLLFCVSKSFSAKAFDCNSFIITISVIIYNHVESAAITYLETYLWNRILLNIKFGKFLDFVILLLFIIISVTITCYYITCFQVIKGNILFYIYILFALLGSSWKPASVHLSWRATYTRYSRSSASNPYIFW